MRQAATASFASLALIGAQACSSPPPVDVIAGDGALCDLTRRLAGSELRVSCILGPEDDPHQLQLTPQQTRQIRDATLVLINGYGLTPALDRLPNTVKVAELAVPNSPELHESDHGESGHSHGDRDPHVWHDPQQAAAMVAFVSKELAVLAPEHAGVIEQRAKAMQNDLTALDRWNQAQFSTIPAPRVLASGHRAFASLARAYKLKELPVLDATSSSESLRPQALAQVVNDLKQQGVRRLFSEQVPANRSLQRISQLSGVRLAMQPLLADAAGANLMNTLTANTCLIVNALGGRCDQEGAEQLVQRWQANN